MQAEFARPIGSQQKHRQSYREVGLTPRICMAPEYNGSVLVRRIPQNIVQLYCEAVEMANVKWTEVGVEGII
jgi:hypothetical protein